MSPITQETNCFITKKQKTKNKTVTRGSYRISIKKFVKYHKSIWLYALTH